MIGASFNAGDNIIEWTPILAEHGPISLTLEGYSGVAALIGCDASLRPESPAAWAAVRGDGRAFIGWYTAEQTSAPAAELRAVQGALAQHGSGEVTVLTDSAGAVDITTQLRDGQFPPKQEWPVILHPEHLQELKRSLPQQMHIHGIHSDRRDGSKNRAPEHSLLRAAHQLAWMLRRLVADGHPLDKDAIELLQAAAPYGKSAIKKNAWRKYQAWDKRQNRRPAAPTRYANAGRKASHTAHDHHLHPHTPSQSQTIGPA